MAWATLTQADLIAYALVSVGCAFAAWQMLGGGRRPALLTSRRPGRALATVHAGLSLVLVSSIAPAAVFVAVFARPPGGGPCLAASGVHYALALYLVAGVGVLTGARLSLPAATVSSLGVVGLLYFAGSAVTDVRLINVGTRPLPMSDLEPSWPFIAYLAPLVLLLVALLLSVAAARYLVAAGAVAILAVWSLVVPAPSFLHIVRPTEVCRSETAFTICTTDRYAWALGQYARHVGSLESRAMSAGLPAGVFPRRLRVGDSQATTPEGMAEVPLSYSVALTGHVTVEDAAPLLVTPSWCPALRGNTPPVGLLRQADALTRWLIDGPTDDGGEVALTPAMVEQGLVSARGCAAAPWVPAEP